MTTPASPFREELEDLSPEELELFGAEPREEDETWLSGIAEPPTPAEAAPAEAALEADAFDFGESEAEFEADHPVTAYLPLPAGVLEALSHGLSSVAIGLAAAAGYTDVDQLTNVLFYFRHPGMVGRKIRPDEQALAKEWIAIRDRIVKPALHSAPTATVSAPPPVSGTALSSAMLQWPGATTDELAFMRAVYDAHAAHSKASGRPFVADLPKSMLDTVDGFEARKDAAAAASRLLEEARVALAADGLAGKAQIGIVSAYRPATLQFQIWQGRMFDGTPRRGGFPYYYKEAIDKGVIHAGDFSPAAVEAVARYLGNYIASPGYSNHQDGRAFDFGTGEVGKHLGALGWKSWFRHWLEQNGARLQFVPLASEAWHWTYTPPGQHELEAELYDIPTTKGIKTGRVVVAHAPLLARHRGVGPDMVLRWNDMASVPQELDVVVHLHGFWYPRLNLERDIEPVSGLDLGPIEGDSGAGRSRPTLTVLPRGNDTGVKQPHGPYNAYTFPALVAHNGLTELVDYALGQFAVATGGQTPRVARLILTAHSGGGLALVEILRHHDPHQVHVFDALYWSPSSLIEWARRRIRQDRAAGASREYMTTRGGALRVFYQGGFRGGTRPNSLAVLRSIAPELGDGLDAWYRVEASGYGHFQIPRRYGWRVLADASADVPEGHRETASAHEAEEEETWQPEAPGAAEDEERWTPETWLEAEDEDVEYGLVDVAPEYDTPRVTGTATTVVEPFPSAPFQVTFGATIGMGAITGDPELSLKCAALADLTDDPAKPAFGGVNDDEVLYPGSLQKISAMYAAFQLRSQVQAQVRGAIADGLSTSKPGWEKIVTDSLKRDWLPKLRAEFPKLPGSFPQLAAIFELSATGDVTFRRKLTDDEINQLGTEGSTASGLFGDWLALTIRWSNNVAASRCIRALGYPYLNGVLKAAGFFGGSPAHGLWLSGDYEGHDWIPNSPGSPQANRAGRALAKRWATAQGRTLSNMTATAAQVSRLLTLIAQQQLVDAGSSSEMLQLLDQTGPGIGSYVNTALTAAGRPPDKLFAKIGWGDDTRFHDCAIVERTLEAGKKIRYVVVGLGSKPNSKPDLYRLFVALDDVIVARHP